MDEKPNYYAVIPAFVRYDEELSPNAKLLYAEITALTNGQGYCWASNGYFSNLYSCSERQIRRILKQLSDKKYIQIEVKNGTERKIFITDRGDKNVIGGGTKMSYPLDKNVLPPWTKMST